MKKILALLLALLLTASAFAGCSKGAPSGRKDADGAVKIVTTIFPIYDWLKNITAGAEDIELTMLLDSGADLHNFQPTADDIIKISECDLFVYVGGESDGWAEDALDKFWIINPKITVKTAYKGADCDINMLTMDNTLERVQAQNIVYQKEAFEGKSVCAYGRILNDTTLEDPYYDNSWTVSISGDFELPAFGTLVIVTGTVKDGGIADCAISENTQY